jgi:hypothetical protein
MIKAAHGPKRAPNETRISVAMEPEHIAHLTENPPNDFFAVKPLPLHEHHMPAFDQVLSAERA